MDFACSSLTLVRSVGRPLHSVSLSRAMLAVSSATRPSLTFSRNVRCLQGMVNCLTHKGVHRSKSTRQCFNLILWIAAVPWPFWYLKRYSWCFHWSGTFQIHRLGLFSARRISSFILYIHIYIYIYTCGNIKTGFVYFQTEPASVSTSCKWLPVHFLSLVSKMPKKNIHENNKNQISCFFCLRGVLIPPSLLPS